MSSLSAAVSAMMKQCEDQSKKPIQQFSKTVSTIIVDYLENDFKREAQEFVKQGHLLALTKALRTAESIEVLAGLFVLAELPFELSSQAMPDSGPSVVIDEESASAYHQEIFVFSPIMQRIKGLKRQMWEKMLILVNLYVQTFNLDMFCNVFAQVTNFGTLTRYLTELNDIKSYLEQTHEEEFSDLERYAGNFKQVSSLFKQLHSSISDSHSEYLQTVAKNKPAIIVFVAQLQASLQQAFGAFSEREAEPGFVNGFRASLLINMYGIYHSLGRDAWTYDDWQKLISEITKTVFGVTSIEHATFTKMMVKQSAADDILSTFVSFHQQQLDAMRATLDKLSSDFKLVSINCRALIPSPLLDTLFEQTTNLEPGPTTWQFLGDFKASGEL